MDLTARTSLQQPHYGAARARHIDGYAWMAVIATCDFACTAAVLALGGREVNPLAAQVLAAGGLYALFAYRALIVLAVLALCEWLWRRQPGHARFALRAALFVSVLPVLFALLQMGLHRPG